MKTFMKKAVKQIPSLLPGIYICCFLVLLLCAVFTAAPREIRDAANVSLAEQFASLQNPYILSEGNEYVESINVYPPLNMLFAAFLHILTGLNLYNIFYALDFLYVALTAVVITRFVQKELHSPLFLNLLVFAASLTLGWRAGFISTVPDHLGMLMIVLLLVSLKHKGRYVILVQAILSVLGFYSKQYFLAACAPVFFYYLLTNRKAAWKYFLYTAVIGLLSMGILHILCPALSVQLLFFMSAENSGLSMEKLLYSLKQMFLCLATYGIFSLFVLKRYLVFLHRLLTGKAKWTEATIFDIHNIVMFLVLLYLGTNKGAFLSYHLTLLAPGLLIVGSMEINKTLSRFDSSKKLPVQFIIGLISLLLLLKKYQLPYVYSEEDKISYTRIESILSQYEAQEVYLVSQLGYSAYKNQLPLAENGHEDYIISLADSRVVKTPIDIQKEARLYPFLMELYHYSVSRKKEVTQLIQNKAYALITRTNGSTLLYGCDISDTYTCIESLPLRTGNQISTIDFWIPKTGIRHVLP